MRLDHLLSKEHLEASAFQAAGSERTSQPAAHGWNIDIGIHFKDSYPVRPLRWVGTVGVGGVGACTLLGPEGPGAVPAAGSYLRVRGRGGGGLDSSGLHRDRPGGWWVWGFWPSVENYIVDASILD